MTQEDFDNLKIGDIIFACTNSKYVITEVIDKGTYKVKSLDREVEVLGGAFIAYNWTLDKPTNPVCI